MKKQMKTKIFFLLMCFFLISATSDVSQVIIVEDVPPISASDTTALASYAFDAIKAGESVAAFGFCLMIAIAFIRKYASKAIPFLNTKIGGYALAFVTSAISAIAISMTNESFGIETIAGSLGIGLTAIGVHTATKDANQAIREKSHQREASISDQSQAQ